MTGARRIALAAVLVSAAPACKDKKKAEPEASSAPTADKTRPAASRSPASEPNLPKTLALDCRRIVPDAVRAAHFADAELVPTVVGPIATCVFKSAGDKAGPSVSLFCHQRKRNWSFADELARDPHKTAVKDLGRDAYARGDHVFFYPSKLDCLARVIWPGDPAKAAAVAKEIEPNLTIATVSPAPPP